MLVFSDEMTERLYDLERIEPVAKYLLMPWADNPDGPNYLDLATNEPGVATFVPRNRIERARREGGMWRTPNRQDGKVGRVVRQAMHPALVELVTDAQIESFVNAIGTAASLGEWSLVTGEDIRRYYHEKTYRSGSGSLNSSCMRYDSHQKFFDLYVANPDQVKLLILLDPSGMLRGRALTWHYPDGMVVMDRAYSTDRGIRGFEEHARSNGWHMRSARSGYGVSVIADAKGNEKKVPPIALPNHQQTMYPFLDTYGWYCPDDGTFAPYDHKGDGRVLTLHNTQGNDHAAWRKRTGACQRCGNKEFRYTGTSLTPLDLKCDCARCKQCGYWVRPGGTCRCRVCEGCGKRGNASQVGRKYYCDACYDTLTFCALCGNVATGDGTWTHGALIVCNRCMQASRREVEYLLRENFRLTETCQCEGCVEMRRQRDATFAEWERRRA